MERGTSTAQLFGTASAAGQEGEAQSVARWWSFARHIPSPAALGGLVFDNSLSFRSLDLRAPSLKTEQELSRPRIDMERRLLTLGSAIAVGEAWMWRSLSYIYIRP